MKLYILDNGTITMVGDNPVTREEEAGRPVIPIHTFLLDTPAGYILFDTGCHPQAMDGAWPKEMCENPYDCGPGGCLTDRLAQLRVSPEEIRTIVLSHLHLDHAGGVHLFPNARVYVHQDELEQVLRDDANGTLGIFHQKCDVDNWRRADAQWVVVPRDTRELSLCGGVTILNLGAGHSYGMLGLLVELSRSCFLLASDAIYSRAHFEPVPQLSGVVYDEAGYFRAMEHLRKYAAKHHAEILFGHDMSQFRSLKKSTDGWYE